MKTVSNILRIALIVFSVCALVLFFFPFANITNAGGAAQVTGAMASFHGQATVGEDSYNMATSLHIWFNFWLVALTVLFSALTFKFKGVKWAALVTSLASSIYMLVIALGSAKFFIDFRPIPDVTAVTYTPFVIYTVIALFVTLAAAVAYIITADACDPAVLNGQKPPVFKRIGNFFKDYKGEVKKVVWPGFNDVLKNTLIVLGMCLILGLFIWLLDFGLGQLLNVLGNIGG